MIVMFYIYDMLLRLLKMGCTRMQKCNDYAVSEIMGLLLALLLFTGVFCSIVLFGIPYMNDQKSIVALESNLLQLDVLGNLMDDVFSEGAFDLSADDFGSSKSMEFKMGDGSISIQEEGSRFIFWYSVYDGFDFNVTELGFDANQNEFKITITDDIGDNNYRLKIIYLNSPAASEYQPDEDGNLNPNIISASELLVDAIKIDVEYDFDDTAVFSWQNVGRIWLYDLGSIVYSAPDSYNSYKAVVENGGVFSLTGGSKAYIYNEPKYWNQTLFDNNDSSTNAMLTFAILQIKNNPNKGVGSVGGTGSTKVKLQINSDINKIMESKAKIYSNFKLIIDGDEPVVNAWKNYFKNSLEFEDKGDRLSWFPNSNNVMFTLLSSINYFSMEVRD